MQLDFTRGVKADEDIPKEPIVHLLPLLALANEDGDNMKVTFQFVLTHVCSLEGSMQTSSQPAD